MNAITQMLHYRQSDNTGFAHLLISPELLQDLARPDEKHPTNRIRLTLPQLQLDLVIECNARALPFIQTAMGQKLVNPPKDLIPLLMPVPPSVS
jgi:hypothetical protein